MKLFDIFDRKKWQSMQDGFSKALGVSIQTVKTDGKPYPEVINKTSSFCSEIAGFSCVSDGHKRYNCVEQLINAMKHDKYCNHIICPFGLYLYGIPVALKELGVLSYIIVGPIMLQKQKSMPEYEKIAKDMNLPLDSILEGMADFKKFSFIGVESMVQLLSETAHYVLELSWDIKKLRERFDVSLSVDDVIKKLYSSVYFEEILNTLLEVSLHTTKCEAGSVMLFDPENNELTIKFSRGLDKNIVNKARVKIGEGISGIAARDRKPLLIDEEVDDKEIKNRLKRPNIKSSIVYPIETRNSLLGVMNINNTNPENRFNPDTLELIGNFTRLTKAALNLFPKKVEDIIGF